MSRPHGYIKTTDIELVSINSDAEWAEDRAMTESMAAVGQLHPIIVAKSGLHLVYTLVAGRRRLASAKALGWETILCDIYETELQAAAAIALAEGVRSENPLAVGRLLEQAELDPADILRIANLNTTQAAKRQRLTNLLPELQTAIENGSLRITAAYRLARLSKTDQERAWNTANHMANEQKKTRPTIAMVDRAIRMLRDSGGRLAIQLSGFEYSSTARIDPIGLAAQLERWCADAMLEDEDDAVIYAAVQILRS